MCAVADARADPVPASPVYQDKVFAAVPATRLVAALNGGGPWIRSGDEIAVTVGLKPSAPSAAGFELVTVRSVLLAPCRVIAPPLIVEWFEVPVIESILLSKVWTLSVTLSWLPVAPA